VEAHPLDVRDATAFADFARDVLSRGAVDVLVNNAGIAVGGPLAATPPADWELVVSVNLLGVVNGCAAFVPAMLQNPRRTHVVNISSASGYSGTPGLGAYSVTKVAVKAYSEVLAAESDPKRLLVHCVLPGFVPTAILDRARLTDPDPEGARRRAREAFFPKSRSPEQVAEATLSAMNRGTFLVPVFRESHIARLLSKLPDPVQRWARRRVWDRFRAVSEGR
jgi:short-subunit dehydrogenase